MSSPEFAVQALYGSNYGWLNTWLRARLGNAADATDLAQDTFVRLLQKTERLELKALCAFLRTIAHLPEAETPSAEARALVIELLESIARMLEGLKPKVRQAVLLAQCEGLTHKQIAEQMGLSLRSVERYVADALYHCDLLRYET